MLMNRAVQIAMVSLITIALALIGQKALPHPAPQLVSSGAPDATATAPAQAYAAAVDRFLATGDNQPLRDIIGVEFTNWAAGNATPTDYDALQAHLDSVRTLFPGLTLRHTPLHSGNGFVIVQLSPSTLDSASFAGMAIAPEELIDDREILRFDRGRLVERWSFPSIQGSFTAFAATPAGNPGFATLSRFSVLDGVSTNTSFGASNAALIVEQGAIRLGIDQSASSAGVLWMPSGEQISLDSQTTLDLPAGSAVFLPAGTLSHVWAPPGQSGTVLVVSLQVVVAAGYAPIPRVDIPIGKPADPRGNVGLDGRHITLQIGHMHLETGSTFRLAEAGGTILALLASGSIDVESPDRSIAALAPGQSIVSKSGASLTFHVTSAEGADIDLLTFAPV